jgi:hypothetical protein
MTTLSDEEIHSLFQKYIKDFKDNDAGCYAFLIHKFGISPSRIMRIKHQPFCKQTLYNKLHGLEKGDGFRKHVFCIIFYFYFIFKKGKTS